MPALTATCVLEHLPTTTLANHSEVLRNFYDFNDANVINDFLSLSEYTSNSITMMQKASIIS
jgi:hypothetical protein